MRLKDKVALITGAGHGIGRGIALRFAEEGAKVIVNDIDAGRADETVGLIAAQGGTAQAMTANIAERSQVEDLVRQAVETLGPIDILVNNAGTGGNYAFLDLPDGEWDRVLAVNLKGPFICSQVVARVMVSAERKGRIINIASIESEVPLPKQAHYATSKAGVWMLTKAMALELARYGIRVNAIGPGYTDAGYPIYQDPAFRAAREAMIPLSRVGLPRDIANAAVFLASDESDYITGTLLFVDGGWLLQ